MLNFRLFPNYYEGLDDAALSDADKIAYGATNVGAALDAQAAQIAEALAGGGGDGVSLEQVQDNLGNTSLIAGTSLTKAYDDAAGTITLSVESGDFATAAQGTLAQTSVQVGDTIPIADGGTGATTRLGAVQALRIHPVTVTGTTDTLNAEDDRVNLYTAAGLVTVTLADIAIGFECVLVSLGAGGLTVAAGDTSWANGFTPKRTIAQGEALYVKQTAASTFILIGGTAT
jgi:hypothetical protein